MATVEGEDVEKMRRRRRTILQNFYGATEAEQEKQAAPDPASIDNAAFDADRYFERALRMLEEVHGSEHPNVGITVMNLGYSARDRGDCTKALPYFTRALGIFEKLGPTHPYIAHTLVGRAHCNAELDQSAGIADAERAIEILQSQTSDPAQVAEARFALARAIWKREPARARKLATDARATFVASGAAAKASLVQVDEWLAKH